MADEKTTPVVEEQQINKLSEVDKLTAQLLNERISRNTEQQKALAAQLAMVKQEGVMMLQNRSIFWNTLQTKYGLTLTDEVDTGTGEIKRRKPAPGTPN
jgi:hypothetical protein